MSTAASRDDRAIAPPDDPQTERRVVEALIFVSDEPVTAEQIGQVLKGRSLDEIRAVVEALDAEYRSSGRALRIEEVAGGWRLSTQPELAPWIRSYFRNRNRSRLSAAAVETLAVIAYKQPITAPEIQEIRGVDPQGSLRTLLEKRLVRIAGKKKVVGRPFLYGTTRDFLMHFGLASIEELPPIEDFEQLAGDITQVEGPVGGGEQMSDDVGPVTAAGTKGEKKGASDAGPEGEGIWEEQSWTRDGRAARKPGSGGDAEEE